MAAQRIIDSLDFLISLGLGVSVRVGNIQTIFLDLDVVVLGSRNLHINRDDILIRDSNRGSLGSTTGVNIHQSSSGDLDNLAGADGQLDLLGHSIVSAALDNHILTKIDSQLIAAKHRHLDGAGLGIIGGRMDNTSQRGGNRGIALGNTQDTSIIGDISNKHTLAADNLSHLAADIISNSLGAGDVVIGCAGGRDRSNDLLGHLNKITAIEGMDSHLRGLDIKNALLTILSGRQVFNDTNALGILNRTLEQLMRIRSKIQGTGFLDLQSLVVSVLTKTKIHVCHIFSPLHSVEISLCYLLRTPATQSPRWP